MKQEMVGIDRLTLSPERDIRQIIVDEIKEKIIQYGYIKTKAFAVQKINGNYLVKGGNHRLKALQELGIDDEFLCLVYSEDEDPRKIAFSDNRSEDVIGHEDVFDWLEYIKAWRRTGHKQAEIAKLMGWSREQVRNYVFITDNIGTDVLNFAKEHQEGRVPANGTNVPIYKFTEGWFRNSGLYDLAVKDRDKNIIPLEFTWKATYKDADGKDKTETVEEEYDFQMEFMEWFADDRNCKAPNSLIKSTAKNYKEIMEQLGIIHDSLSSEIDDYAKTRKELRQAVLKSEYGTEQLIDVIEKLNEGAKSRALFGVDALDELKKMVENKKKVDCVVTDPPWGVNFKPARETGNPNFDENIEETIEFLERAVVLLRAVMKENAHMYMFFPTVHYHEFRTMLEKYFHVEPIPLIWVKNNHNPCDFENRYASKYETIFFCKMEKGDERKLNNGASPDVLIFNKVKDKYHDCQKPMDLLEHLIRNSTGEKETILDPFSGSGSTLLAAAKAKRFYIGFEKEKEYESKFKRLLGEIVK